MFRIADTTYTSAEFVEMLKSRPDFMFVTTTYIAVWHSGLETAILIPGDFAHTSDAEANLILQANLDKINEM